MSRTKKTSRKPQAKARKKAIDAAVWDLGEAADFIETSRKALPNLLAGWHEGNSVLVLDAIAELASCLECAASEIKMAVGTLTGKKSAGAQ